MSDAPGDTRSDQPPDSWVQRAAPRSWRPYLLLARLDRPIGTWLLLWPCWWSIALAASGPAPAWPDPLLLALFGVGALVMRGAGCTFNDLVDRDYDARVARTRHRPLPSGQITPRQAVAFLTLLLFVGLAILVSFNRFAVLLGVASLVLAALYPFMKRITYWPQFFLGLAFNYGALLGWAAVTGDLAPAAIALYIGGIAWTLGYDTIYAHQDKEDDALIGLKSTALMLGAGTRPWLVGFYAAAAAGFAVAGWSADLGWVFYPVLALGIVHLAWQAARVDIDDPADCLVKFKSNRDFGFIVMAAIVAGQAF